MFLDFLPRAENNGTFKRSRSYTILRQGQHKKRELGTKHLQTFKLLPYASRPSAEGGRIEKVGRKSILVAPLAAGP